MCGISGKVSWDGSPVDVALVKRMMETLVHRGPDDDGMYVEQQVVLGHRRLAIIDLNTGKQPISNEDRTVWVVFNGEIYNFRQLRHELIQTGHRFETQTDTEVIVHLYEEHGEGCVARLRGMFAFAIWDVRKKRLLLARDRVGIKPLYYFLNGKSLVFASEIKALLVDPSVNREIDPQVIHKFLTFLYTPGPETLIRSVRKVEPGHYLVLEDGKVRVREYWDLAFPDDIRNGDVEGAAAALIELLRETVRDHMISDVPVGILLSGGVDSTAMLSFAADQTDREVKTFTIGFEGEGFPDERPYARLAAQHFGTKHYEATITPQGFRDLLPKYVWHMEEPVYEPPAVALYYVTKLAREHVKVLISGEGGDEAFAGYQNYRNLVWLERLKAMRWPWKEGAEMMLGGLSRMKPFARFAKYSTLMQVPLEQYYYSRTADPYSPFNRLREKLYTPGFRAQIDPTLSLAYIRQCFSKVTGRDPLTQMLYVDTKTWLPDDLLVKADKMTMANSVELRVPLLDHKVLEFAASLPASHKLHGFTTKYILKPALNGRVPQEVIKRKKTGFPVPIDTWIRTDLRDFCRDVLLDGCSLARGYFDKRAVENLFERPEEAATGSAELFSLVTLELWHRCFLDGRT